MMVGVWQQKENNQLAEDISILQRDIGILMKKIGRKTNLHETRDLPSTFCPGFCEQEISMANVIIYLLHTGDTFGFRLGEAIMATLRAEEALTDAVA